MPARHCKTIYTTNAITPLNSMIRKAIKKRKVFPHNKTILKIVYLAIHAAAKKCSRSIQNWQVTLNRFIIESPACMLETL